MYLEQLPLPKRSYCCGFLLYIKKIKMRTICYCCFLAHILCPVFKVGHRVHFGAKLIKLQLSTSRLASSHFLHLKRFNSRKADRRPHFGNDWNSGSEANNQSRTVSHPEREHSLWSPGNHQQLPFFSSQIYQEFKNGFFVAIKHFI